MSAPRKGGNSSWQRRKRQGQRPKPKQRPKAAQGSQRRPANDDVSVEQLKSRLAHSLTMVEQARRVGMQKVAVLVSSGKDSVLLADVIVRAGMPAEFINHYLVPNLEIDEIVLTAMEKKYGITIHRLPSARRMGMFESDTLCIKRVFDADASRANGHSSEFDKLVERMSGTPWRATGIRITDGPQRALSLTKHPNPNSKTKRLYPIAEWRKGEVWSYIRRMGLPISPAYELIGRSLDCLNVAHVYPLKHGMPGDYAKIIADYPLMEVLCWLYEKRVARYGLASIGEC